MSDCVERLFVDVVSSKTTECEVGKKSSKGGNGGYDVTLCEESGSEKFLCELCRYILKEPIQTIRGHLACALCYENRKE